MTQKPQAGSGKCSCAAKAKSGKPVYNDGKKPAPSK
jgi:hypothetical protein